MANGGKGLPPLSATDIFMMHVGMPILCREAFIIALRRLLWPMGVRFMINRVTQRIRICNHDLDYREYRVFFHFKDKYLTWQQRYDLFAAAAPRLVKRFKAIEMTALMLREDE